jgi:hypothetical protein
MNRIVYIAGRLTIALSTIVAIAPVVNKVLHSLWG